MGKSLESHVVEITTHLFQSLLGTHCVVGQAIGTSLGFGLSFLGFDGAVLYGGRGKVAGLAVFDKRCHTVAYGSCKFSIGRYVVFNGPLQQSSGFILIYLVVFQSLNDIGCFATGALEKFYGSFALGESRSDISHTLGHLSKSCASQSALEVQQRLGSFFVQGIQGGSEASFTQCSILLFLQCFAALSCESGQYIQLICVLFAACYELCLCFVLCQAQPSLLGDVTCRGLADLIGRETNPSQLVTEIAVNDAAHDLAEVFGTRSHRAAESSQGLGIGAHCFLESLQGLA